MKLYQGIVKLRVVFCRDFGGGGGEGKENLLFQRIVKEMSLQKLKIVHGLRKLEASCMTLGRSLDHSALILLTHKIGPVKKYRWLEGPI